MDRREERDRSEGRGGRYEERDVRGGRYEERDGRGLRNVEDTGSGLRINVNRENEMLERRENMMNIQVGNIYLNILNLSVLDISLKHLLKFSVVDIYAFCLLALRVIIKDAHLERTKSRWRSGLSKMGRGVFQIRILS